MATNNILLVGITGGIGSGKSIVCKIFNQLGILSYDSDSRARKLMEEDEELVDQITANFGGVYSGGKLDRKKLGSQVFQNEKKLTVLNSLVHPAVTRDFKRWVEQNEGQSILIKEAALLVETESYKELDKLIVVSAPEELRIKRVVSRDAHRTESDVKDIIAKQLPESQKTAVADFVIVNDDKQMVIPQVLEVVEMLKSK